MAIANVVLVSGGLLGLLSHMSLFAWVILIVLLIMSFITWGVIINKWKVYRAAEADSRRFFHTFRRRASLKEAHGKCLIYKSTPLARVFEEGFREWESLMSAKHGGARTPGQMIKLEPDEMEAIDRILEKEANEQIKHLERQVSYLATAANSAPFIGLLGTCYGIMNAFMNIGQQGSASLVVVAPGIAEALIATIVGLAVAIPSVMAYNWANTKLKFFADDLNNFSLEFLAAVTKEQI
ncbi:MAG: MotA/TolQ/ExbB proton channel family protein [candidate division Zixibacteria bacterium]|nr:MotA/TolQ/ExbB proton channel family protein [candidate division Zixibacteria bacterium]